MIPHTRGRLRVRIGPVLAALACSAVALPAGATLRYGPLQLSGSVDSQTLVRTISIDQYQFIQNRNTVLLRVDYDWLENGRFVDRLDVPWVDRSKLYLLYRGTYDSFWDIGPGGRQRGFTRYDDLVGGPIVGNTIGDTTTTCPPGGGSPCPRPGLYTRISREGRDGFATESTLREAYVDTTLRDLPLSFRIGRQQVIWGESDQFRLMDIINPLDLTWHLQQEDWDKIRIPLWLIKGIWDFGTLGPISNAFVEAVYNPGDFQPGVKIDFLPAPWSVPVPNPVRAGQIQLPSPTQSILLSPVFDLQGTSFSRGDFPRNPAHASEVFLRFHGLADLPALDMKGIEFTANYLCGRSRGIGAVAGEPFGLKIERIVVPTSLTPASAIRQNPGDPTSPLATFSHRPVFPADVTAEFIQPYTNIFGITGNYFDGAHTAAVFRLETAYQLGAPFETAALSSRVHVVNEDGVEQPQVAPYGYTTRDVWAGMLGFDRPTWIPFLNPRATWFLTGQFFWSFVNGAHSDLRGALLTAGEAPYFTPSNNPSLPANLRQNGVGQWDNGAFAGQVERTQNANLISGNADNVEQWELLTTLAATSFYRGGTVVPFIAIAVDPVNRNFLAQFKVDLFLTNNLIVQPQARFYSDLGGGPSLEPWGAGGLSARRDEVGIKITYQL